MRLLHAQLPVGCLGACLAAGTCNFECCWAYSGRCMSEWLAACTCLRCPVRVWLAAGCGCASCCMCACPCAALARRCWGSARKRTPALVPPHPAAPSCLPPLQVRLWPHLQVPPPRAPAGSGHAGVWHAQLPAAAWLCRPPRRPRPGHGFRAGAARRQARRPRRPAARGPWHDGRRGLAPRWSWLLLAALPRWG